MRSNGLICSSLGSTNARIIFQKLLIYMLPKCVACLIGQKHDQTSQLLIAKGKRLRRYLVNRYSTPSIVHITDTKSSSLKLAVDDFFSRHGLIISRLRGQGYDGASNMRALVAVAKKHSKIVDLFTMVSNVVNVVGASAKRRDMFREKHADAIFEALNNNELLSGGGRPKCRAQPITNLHYYRVDLFVDVIDIQLRELNDRFNEKNTELLCMACLSPSNSFSAFDKAKLMRLAQFYPSDFPEHDIKLLENYIWDMSSNNKFTELKGITDLAQKMVETKKGSDLPFSVLASDTSVNPTCCDRKCRTSVFYYEYCEESVTQLNGGFVDE
ncbi:hypothetical protein L3X38_025527 [Prunus dulcis]|uniref:DUF4371 domain-containing protein n=1 Tax=Prunus dulcis TaxID=3755 RepID=A0AAD4Z7I1_PRUDU|nr:hypothetical protein L3X38_025527 [Prunus dulcis]